MKKPIIILLTLSFFACSTDNKTDNANIVAKTNIGIPADTNIKINSKKHFVPIPLTIIPGQGFDNIKLGKSNYKDVLKFKNLKFVIDSGRGIACGDDNGCNWLFTNFSNKESGLLIEYSTQCITEQNTPETYKWTLSKITVTDNNEAVLKNGIRIGNSTYSEVAKIFGPIPKNWQNEEYLLFEKKGISFRFDSNSKLSEVEIFKPYKIKTVGNKSTQVFL